MARKYQSVQIEDGKWYALLDYTHTECCDCGLVHREEFMLKKGRLYWRATVDPKRTAVQRKKHGITVTRKPDGSSQA